MRWHCPSDTGFEIRPLVVLGLARFFSVTEVPHNIESLRVSGEFFFVSLKLEGQSGLLTREFRLSKQEALTTEPGPRPSSRKELDKCCVSVVQFIPANTRHWTNVGLMLAHRLRRRPNIDLALVQCLVFSGIWLLVGLHTVACTQRIWFIHDMFCQLWAVNCAWVTRTSNTFYIINTNKKSQHSYIRLVRQLYSVSSFLAAWKDV